MNNLGLSDLGPIISRGY